MARALRLSFENAFYHTDKRISEMFKEVMKKWEKKADEHQM